MRAGVRDRQVVNLVNLSTLLGLAVALAGRAKLQRGPHGLLLARGFRIRFPRNPAFTIGDVVLLRLSDEALARRPQLLDHEARHSVQYAFCLGLPFLPLYGLASVWSWLRTRDAATGNVFERLAGLAEGGYGKVDHHG
jgi:hypothetical protein